MNPLAWDAPRLVVYAALFCIVFARASATYAIGRGLIAGVSRTRFAARMQGPHFARARELVARYGAPVVAICFLTVGFQTMVLLAAGTLRMPLRRFIPALVTGATLWSLLYGTVGFVGVELWLALYRVSPVLAIVGTAALISALVGFVLWRRIRAQESSPAAASSAAEPASR